MLATITKIELIFILLAILNVAASLENRVVFPKNFIFGTATSAYQVEGAWNIDGKGPSIWDNFTHSVPSPIENGDTGDVACNSYYRFKEDVQNVKRLGLKMYRFSVSWPRILPTGYADNINQKGLDYYKALVKEIINNDLIPVCSIHHWDLPQRLVDDGNDWRSEKITPIFVNYSRIVIQNLPDVKIWVTINEPKQICRSGYGSGQFPPLVHGSGTIEYECTYVVLKTHAAVYRMYKKEFPNYTARMTIVIDCSWIEPYSKSPEDIAAAERLIQFKCGVFYNPLCNGDWPDIVKERVQNRSAAAGLPQSRLPVITKSDRLAIQNSIDLVTLNHYTTFLAVATDEGPSNETSFENDVAADSSFSPKWTIESNGAFAIVPNGIYKALKWLDMVCPKRDILITELGMAENGTSLDDQIRIDFYHDYLCKILEAMQEGVKVEGIIFWSLMDNFEWLSGFSAHFGFFYVNATGDPTLARIPKKSVAFVQQLGKYRSLNCGKLARDWPRPFWKNPHRRQHLPHTDPH